MTIKPICKRCGMSVRYGSPFGAIHQSCARIQESEIRDIEGDIEANRWLESIDGFIVPD